MNGYLLHLVVAGVVSAGCCLAVVVAHDFFTEEDSVSQGS